MLKTIYLFSIIVMIFIASGCGENNPVTNTNVNPYQKIITAEQGNVRFEIWSATADTLMTGYNRVGFKVYIDNQQMKSGFVKFHTKMYHTGSSSIHGTPVQDSYNYNTSLDLFEGYIIMLMPNDTTSTWYGFYNYNDQYHVDSVSYQVRLNTLNKFKIFVDLNTGLSYLITLLDPLQAHLGNNTFRCTLHESHDFISFTQALNAQMHIKPWLDSLSHSSSGNTDPVDSGGIYTGTVNFDNNGLWNVYDTIYYHNTCITQSGGTPSIVFILH